MARWIFKQEPNCYSFADLRRDGRTVWDGVGNPLARKYLRRSSAAIACCFITPARRKRWSA